MKRFFHIASRCSVALFTLLTTLFIMTSCKGKVLSPEETLTVKLDSLFNERYAVNGNDSLSYAYPGGAVLIMKGDSIIYDKSWGVANYDNNTKIDGNTFFNIASVSKQFTATSILKLAEEGKLSLDDTLDKYFPDFKNPLFKKIKIKHLISHSSGIPDSRPRDDRNFVLTATDMQCIEYMKNLKELNFEPGTAYEYMNPTFQLLYAIIERVTGESFDAFQRETIFNPAGMEQTLYFSADAEIPNMAHGYILEEESNKDNSDSDLTPEALAAKAAMKSQMESKSFTPIAGGPTFSEYDYGEETFFATKADGGIYTSTHEFAKWEKALRDNKIISKESKECAHSKINPVSGSKFSGYQNRPDTWYGYGWFIEDKEGMPYKVYHTGDNGGFQIYAGRFPEKEILVLLFENRNDLDRWSMVKRIDALLKEVNFLEKE